MPCYRCGARQVDPDRGESPWKRGVRADRQVLICPACQSSVDWTGELDRCPVCSSAHLVRRLGEVECRDCGHVREPGPGPVGVGPVSGVAPGIPASGGPASGASAPGSVSGEVVGIAPGTGRDLGETPGLAEEVELALERVLGRAARPARIG
jgi:hypothetical protein